MASRHRFSAGSRSMARTARDLDLRGCKQRRSTRERWRDSDDGGGNVRGDTDLDVSILKVDVTVPAGANCLTFNFKFLSEEYPVYVGSSFNDDIHRRA